MFPFTCLSLASWSGAWTHPPYHTTYCTFFIQLRSGSRAIQPIADPCLLLESEVIKSYMWPQAPDYLGLLWLKRYMPTRDLSVGTLYGEATWWLYLFCKQWASGWCTGFTTVEMWAEEKTPTENVPQLTKLAQTLDLWWSLERSIRLTTRPAANWGKEADRNYHHQRYRDRLPPWF